MPVRFNNAIAESIESNTHPFVRLYRAPERGIAQQSGDLLQRNRILSRDESARNVTALRHAGARLMYGSRGDVAGVTSESATSSARRAAISPEAK